MPEIRATLLEAPANRCIIANRHDSLISVFSRLSEQGGDLSWLLVADWGGGEFRALRFDGLAIMLDPLDPLPETLEELALPAALAVDRFSRGTGEAQALARRQPSRLLVVTEDGQAVGVIFEGSTLSDDASRIPSSDLLSRLRMNLEMSAPPPDLIPETSPPDGDGAETSRAFSAMPRLDAPAQVAAEAAFTVTVGFRPDLDPALTGVQTIHIENAPPDATFSVTLLTDGARVLGGVQTQPLPLDMQASITFECQAQPGVQDVYLTVHYKYQSQLAGMATRRVAVDADAPVAARLPDPCRLARAGADTHTDLQVTITRSRTRPGDLQWTFVAANPPIDEGPLLTQLGDTREFAAVVINELKTQEYKGLFAAQILDNKAQDIADVMPARFFEILRLVRDAVGRPPTLLLHTDELYVPWELALVDPPLDPDAPPYLAAQTDMGRWIAHERVTFPPPVTLEVQRVTAVAARFGLGTDHVVLKHALGEQARLKDTLGAQALEATRAALQPLAAQRLPGHLIHFAVHGVSNPAGNDQALLLADNTRLIPSALAGRYRCGETPGFAFVFLNACQVGTAAGSLGQAAGFPGDLIRGGAQGFIAPLWDVDDGAASEIAARFYEATIRDGRTIGEFMRTERLRYDAREHTTPMAYIFYGHPRLKLSGQWHAPAPPPDPSQP